MRIAEIFKKKVRNSRLFKKSIVGFSRILFRKKKYWVFTCHTDDYSENTKYLYEYILKNHTRIDCVWVSGNKDVLHFLSSRKMPCCRYGSLLFYLIISSANYFFVSSIYGAAHIPKDLMRAEAFLVNLWHGMPIKLIGMRHNPKLIEKKPECDLTIATSEITKATLYEAWGDSVKSIKITGLPRNDGLFKRGNDNVLRRLKLKGEHMILLYLPTYRALKSGMSGADVKAINELMDSKEINELLKKFNSTLLIKAHPQSRKKIIEKVPISQTKIRIIDTDVFLDVSDLLRISNVLITDYSSCYIDYLLLNRPIIFYHHDVSSYEDERNYFYDLKKICAGVKVKTLNDLFLAIRDALQGKDEYCVIRPEMCNLMHKYKDGSFSARVLAEVLNLCHDKGSEKFA